MLIVFLALSHIRVVVASVREGTKAAQVFIQSLSTEKLISANNLHLIFELINFHALAA